MIKPSSVTTTKIVDGMGKGLGMVYTPHQCWYSDRKSLFWEKSPKVSEGTSGTLITIPNTSLLMALTIFNPLNRTWAISTPPRCQKGYFGPEQPLCQGEDYFAYFEFAKNPTKNGKCLKPKVIPSYAWYFVRWVIQKIVNSIYLRWVNTQAAQLVLVVT